MSNYWHKWLVMAIGLLGLVEVRAQDGLYADFATTSGNFTCRLDFEKVPRTVANFVGLAAGERAWLEANTGLAKKSGFYDGLTFHRVVSGFVIQGGSPKGDGTDGPGYTFRDEFDPTLRHSKAGILSMANSGPHSNGSQFFITLAPATHLDDVHSVFGEVTSGMEVVNAIGNVAVDGNSKPLLPVIMNSVTIRRVGPAANAFDTANQGLPTVGGAAPLLAKTGANFALQFTRALYSEYLLYDSSDLVTWSEQRVGLYVTTPPSGVLDVTTSAVDQGAHFYRVPQIAYPGPLYTPPLLLGAQLHLTFSTGELLDLLFNNAGGGTSALTTSNGTSSGTITQYTWSQEAYRGQLVCQTSNLFPLVLSHVFGGATGGTFKGTVYSASPSPVSGTFTFSNAPAGLARTASVNGAGIHSARQKTRRVIRTGRSSAVLRD
jgi:cyclophilin family peptidyl-prolyl cis-trans isomerase